MDLRVLSYPGNANQIYTEPSTLHEIETRNALRDDLEREERKG